MATRDLQVILSSGEITDVSIDTTATPKDDAVGQIQWNADEDTYDFGQTNGVVNQLGAELNPYFRNASGATITNGTPVMFAGSLGASGKITIQKAIADGTLESSYIIGITTEEISNGSNGHVTWFGKVRGLNTTGALYGETWSDGDILYVSPDTAGYLTNVKPSAPNLQIEVAAVIYAHATQGLLFVRPTWTPNHVSSGELYNPSDVLSLTTTNYTNVTGFTEGENTSVTLDGDLGTMTIVNAGRYVFNSSYSFTFSTNNTTVHICLFKNDVELLNSEIERKIGTGGDVGNSGATCIFTAETGDVLRIKAKSSLSGNLTISHANWNIVKL